MHHESLESKDTEILGSSNRNFGFTFAIVLTIFALWPIVNGGYPRFWPGLAAFIFLLLTLALPASLTIPNRLWFKFGQLLQRIVSPVTLAVLFYGVITPTGLFMRKVLGKKFLNTTFDPNVKSYWIKRDPPGPERDSFTNQF